MISPSPTTRIDPRLARGVCVEATNALVRIAFPNTSYELHLAPTGAITTPPGRRLIGTIAARARRMDSVTTGGRYVEPVMGRPRRVQGTVIAVDPQANTVIVDAGMPIHCTPTDPRQTAGDFQPGQLLSFDVLEGASFTPATVQA